MIDARKAAAVIEREWVKLVDVSRRHDLRNLLEQSNDALSASSAEE